MKTGTVIFDKEFIVAELPAYVTKSENSITGFISYAETENAMLIVALGVLPKYQDMVVGQSLVTKVEAEAKKTRKSRPLISTSNDDLPALAFCSLSVGAKAKLVKTTKQLTLTDRLSWCAFSFLTF